MCVLCKVMQYKACICQTDSPDSFCPAVRPFAVLTVWRVGMVIMLALEGASLLYC